MPESVPEVPSQSQVEAPKPGSMAALEKRLRNTYVINVRQATREDIGEKEKARAENRQLRQSWQIGMLESLANDKAYSEVVTTGEFDPDKAASTMTALDGAERLEKWIEEVLDNPERQRGPEETISDEDVREYAEDLKRQLIDEASRTT